MRIYLNATTIFLALVLVVLLAYALPPTVWRALLIAGVGFAAGMIVCTERRR